MAETIIASFADPGMAEKAVGALLDHGVRSEDISLVANETYARTQYGYTDTGRVDNAYLGDDTDDEEAENPVAAARTGISTTTGADAASAAAKGAGIGLATGVAAALASIFVPGFGLVAGGGALASALAGAAATTAAGAAGGGALGFLKDQGVPEAAAIDYDRAVSSGGAMIAVHVPSGDADRASIEQVLTKYGATNVGAYGA